MKDFKEYALKRLGKEEFEGVLKEAMIEQKAREIQDEKLSKVISCLYIACDEFGKVIAALSEFPNQEDTAESLTHLCRVMEEKIYLRLGNGQ